MAAKLAFPRHPDDRRALQEDYPGPLPALYADGIERPCVSCGLLLDVRPADADRPVVCPRCTLAAMHFGVPVIEKP